MRLISWPETSEPSMMPAVSGSSCRPDSVGVAPRRFFLYDALGAVISVPVVVSLGYFCGPQIDSAVHYLGGFERLVLLAAAACIIFYWSHLLFGAAKKDAA